VDHFETIKESILATVPGASERVLIEQLDITEEDGTILISCPNAFSQKYLSRQYKDHIIRCVRGALQQPVDVHFCVKPARKTRQEKPNSEIPPVQMTLPSLSSPSPVNGLNGNFTFEEFVVGRCNAFAYEAAMAVTEEDISKYNPLYFYSDVGLGKSHIAHAIGNRLLKSKSGVSVRYTTARDFSQDFVHSIRNNCHENFKKTYQPSALDIFFIDDVHLFKNKEKTQMELCHVLDDLISAGRQVVLSGFRPPTSMSQIDKGLRSRFSSGLVIDLKRPDRLTRDKIVRHKAQKNGIILPDEVVEFISGSVLSSIRELESAVMTITAMSSLMKRRVTLDLAKELLEGTLEKQQRITIEFIQNFVAKNFCIHKDTMISPSRKKEIVYPRQVAIFLCRRYTRESLQSIGNAFSRKHSSIIHSLETIDTTYKQNLKVKRELDFLIEKLEAETA
jgi:chromosomal replication initiator protein